jgi:hypothetical protein
MVSILSPHSTADEDAAVAARILSGQLRGTMGRNNDVQVGAVRRLSVVGPASLPWPLLNSCVFETQCSACLAMD